MFSAGRVDPGGLQVALVWSRHLALAGLVAGLLLAPHLAAGGWLLTLAVALPALAWAYPARAGRQTGGPAVLVWLTLMAATAALAGAGLGSARLAAIAGGALEAEPGERASITGFVSSQLRRSGSELRALVQTFGGRVVFTTEGPIPHALRLGSRVRASGALAEPAPWRADELARSGAALELQADELTLLPGGRGGLAGLLDRTRTRAERGLTAGLSPDRAALARGFVLGQDELIDAETRERFMRAGLAHLLAVSGQNVMLLAILAGLLLALARVGPRTRLALIIGAIVVYVPLAGAGPSIQRAGVMGAAGLAAGLAGRPADRVYLPLLAAAVTLCLNPLAASDVGWQMSFAAVIGISVFARPLRDRVEPSLRRLVGSRLARPLAEAAALTIAATFATAPLMAHHFESISIASLPANLLAVPAVAPVMWLGMLAAGLGQFPLIPLEPLGVVQGVLLDYIDQVARLLADPGWALLELPIPRPVTVVVVYAALLALLLGGLGSARLRAGLRLPRRLRRGATAGFAAGVALVVVLGGSAPVPALTPGALRVSMLDVGQGDAILIQAPGEPAVLVDTGPAGAGLVAQLRDRGVSGIGDLIITHDQSDHSGALAELAGAIPIARILHGGPNALPRIRGEPGSRGDSGADPAPGLALSAFAERHSIPARGIVAGDRIRWGGARATVLWPPAAAPPGADPNLSSLVLALEFEDWRVLLTGDAEFEATGLRPGPIDLLKLPHHGSADAGLPTFLEHSTPRLAIAGIGADNPHGHPTDGTVGELVEHGVCLLRTDLSGTISVDLGPSGMQAAPARGGPEEARGEGGCAASRG